MKRGHCKLVIMGLAMALLSVAPATAGDISFATCDGLIGGAQVMFLKPHIGNFEHITLTDGVDQSVIPFGSNDYDLSPRFWLGYVGQCGLGVRARWWQFDHTLAAESGQIVFSGDPLIDDATLDLAGGLKMEAVDLDIMQRTRLGLWELNLGGGARYGAIRHDFQMEVIPVADPPSEFTYNDHVDAVGPTVFGEFRRPIGQGGLALVGNARGALLFGSQRLSLDLEDLGFGVVGGQINEKHDVTMGVCEIQLGVEWSRPISGGGRLLLEALWEAQAWSTSGTYAGLGGGDYGVTGAVFGVGIAR